METRANYAIVGFFTLVVMLSAFGFVYWMAKFGNTGETAPMIVRIPGSANGLSNGSPVRFNGIPYGVIRNISIDPDSPDFVIAETTIRADAPVYTDTRAALEIQGLTGSAYIELQGGSPGNPNILTRARELGQVAVIDADPSGVTNLLATADDILNRANRVIGEVEGFVKDARSPLTETLKNTEVFTAALRDNADGIDDFLQSVADLSQTVKSVSGRIDSTLASAENLITSIDPQKIDRILANVDKVTSDVASASGEITRTLESFSQAAGSLERLAADAGESLDKVDTIIASIDPAKVGQSMDDIALASADARKALADARGVVETFSARKEDYDLIITDVKQLTGRLNAASTRVDGVLAKLDNFLGEGDASSLIADAEATLKSFRDVADSLNARVGPIADNLQRFSGSGLRNVEALVNDARRSIQRIERSISTIEQDPQRLIFGGDTVKQYDGRNRR
ncbi:MULTISPECIES: MlaD family protein [Hoeflea]|jgi:phospholipid/cholesterol/gamma-HCH transport system substrate-binding protein|uniref:MCE family protein n=1 Tax=Hoeflea alexandrii TaxID=288436 RepID=A0ABT1CNY3_9HYPH|nr:MULTISPECIES: MlaD family protein [Hoeflea]MBV6650586.1 MCE family protein [Hoeflea sp.]MCO6407905.1 MCE family protein [Hoeflea alexandrii]MCY0153735.1 MCE family protein [Hoeflea alexandrii]VVT11366.1 MCE family protein [Hoeflea sp. EC-HK425]